MRQSPFQILLIEDNNSDADLVKIHLNKLGLEYHLTRVFQEEDVYDFLESRPLDLIICDYNFPEFNGFDVLEYLRDSNPVLPFILISGYIGEEKAVDAMLKGASDYVLKDNLERLGPAVKRELFHFREQQETEIELDEAIQKLKERIKEQECLYNISSLDDQNLSISDLLNETVKRLPDGFQYPEGVSASIEYDGEIYQTENFFESNRRLTVFKDEIESGPLVINVYYIEAKPEPSNGLFLNEERQLLESVLDNLALKINRILNQKELQEKQDLLREERDRLLEAQRVAVMGDWYFNPETQEITWSPMIFRIFERDPDLGEPSYEDLASYFQTQLDYHDELVSKAIKEGKSYSTDFKIETEKGSEKFIHVEGKPEFDDSGKITRLYGVILDITKRKKAEKELLKSEQRFKSLVQDGMDMIAIVDEEVRYKYVAPTRERIEGIELEIDEYIGKSALDLFHEDDHERVRNALKSLKPNESTDVAPFRFKGKEGEWRWMESTITNLTENLAINGYVTNSRDVTERIKHERKLRDIVENSTNLFYRHDINHVITYISPQSQEFLGCSPAVAKKRWTEFATVHPANEEGFQKTFKAIETGVAQAPYELQLQKVDGEIIWVEVNEAPIVENGKTVSMVGSLTDITARKKYEEKLEELSLVASKTTDVIIMTDVNEHITWVNNAYEELTKYTLEESLGRIPGDFLQGPETDPVTVAKFREAVQARKSVQETILNYDKHGKKYWLDIKIDPLFEDGECTGFIAIERDVTARREALEKLISTEQKLREIVEHSTNIFYKHDINHQLEYISPQSYDFVGLTSDEAKQKWTDLVTDHPKNEIGFKKTQKAIETGKPQGSYELQFKHADGGFVWARIHEAPVVENGKTVAIVGSLTDITAQKKYEEKLEELSLVASKTTDVIIMTDGEDRITWVNEAFEQLMGYTLEDSLGKIPGRLLRGTGTNRSKDKQIQEKKAEHQSIHEVILNYTNEGREIWLDMTADPIFDDDGEFKGYIAIDKDVSEQIRQQRKLQESVERYEIVTKATSDTIWDADLQTDTVTYNSNIYDVFGYEEEKIENSEAWWLSKIHPDHRERVVNEFKDAELSKTDRIQAEYRFQCKDGSYKYINDRAHVINDEDGQPIRMIGAMQDITKQKEENMWLKLLESAIENTTESISILEGKKEGSEGRRILYVNDAFEEMTGFRRNEVLKESLLKFMGPTTNRRSVARLIHSLDNGDPSEAEVSYFNKSGEERWAEISFAPVMDSNNDFSHWICISRDVTERREDERELRESLQEKETLLMEIHHRVKNNLAVVSSMMQLQAMKEKSESLQEKLYDSVARIRTMVTIHELLYESGSFSKIDFSVNLKKLVSMIIETIQSDKKIDLQFDCESVELNVNQAIPASLIVNEIITNAIKHAFKGRNNNQISLELSESDNNVTIRILDNGIGLPEISSQREGSSLGLQLIDVLAKQLNSEYEYVPSKKQGTIFRMQFEKSLVRGIGNAYLH